MVSYLVIMIGYCIRLESNTTYDQSRRQITGPKVRIESHRIQLHGTIGVDAQSDRTSVFFPNFFFAELERDIIAKSSSNA